MSRRYKYSPPIGSNFPMAYIFIILILIVLQWFKSGHTPSTESESNLVNNGGLFIITLFFLIACSCSQSYSCHYKRR